MKHTAILFSLLLIPTATIAEQSCQTLLPETTPNSRFTDNGNNTITDKTTGLTWKKCQEGTTGSDCNTPEGTGNQVLNASSQVVGAIASVFTWQQALQHVDNVNAGAAGTNNHGSTTWRLPNIKELASIVQMNCIQPSANTTLFPSTNYGYDSRLNEEYGVASGTFEAYTFAFNGVTWSSTPNQENWAWGMSFAEGEDMVTLKDALGYIRLVRD